MTTSIKTCFKCGESKSLDSFYKHKQMADGHLNKCKSCAKADAIANRLKRLPYYQAYDRARGSRQDQFYRKRYRKKYPAKHKAHNMVNNSIRDGKLQRHPCEVCGKVEAVAHHDDYLKPLDVRWLCQAHHKQWHAANGEGLNGRSEAA